MSKIYKKNIKIKILARFNSRTNCIKSFNDIYDLLFMGNRDILKGIEENV